MKKIISSFTSAAVAGMCVSIGATAFLSVENKMTGALLFCLGLFVVCTLGYNLFTGKVCYCFDTDFRYVLNLGVIWLGNLFGAWCSASLLRMTRIAETVSAKAAALCEMKLGDSLWSVFILAIFCDVLIYIGVEEYRNNPHQVGKYMALIFAVVVFTMCGFEHCVANMYYVSMAGMWSGRALLFILVNTLGNSVGGLLVPVLKKFVIEKR